MMRRKMMISAAVAVCCVALVGANRLWRRAPAAKMTAAASTFLEGLNADQKAKAAMAYDNAARLDWHFIPKEHRKGVPIKELDAAQRKAALALLQTGLSEIGYGKAKSIMSLEVILRELDRGKTGTPLRDPERYFFTVFGEPKNIGVWGWSLEGHHLSLNYVVRDGEVVAATPSFFGANPATVRTDQEGAPKKGTRILGREEDAGFELVHSMTADQMKQVLIAEKAPNELRGAAQPKPPADPPQGLPASKMTDVQVALLAKLIGVYAENMPADLAEARLAALHDAGMENVYFSWAGATKPGIGHYYVVQGPTFVIELVNTQPDSAGNPANHIHSMWRSMTGDFGLTSR